MVLTTRHKLLLYRRFECDIWGYCYTDESVELLFKNLFEGKKPNTPSWWKPRVIQIKLADIHKFKSRYFRFFYKLWWERRSLVKKRRSRYVYKFDFPPRWRPPRKFNFRFISVRLTRLYFITFQDHQFRKIFRSAAKKDGNFETNYLRILECRALAIAYRLNLSPDIFWLLNFVKTGRYFLLDFQPIQFINLIIPIGKLLTVTEEWRWKFLQRLQKRICLRTILFPVPKFIFSSYSCFFFYLMRYPLRTDLVYPFSIDLQRITGYY